MTNNKVALSSLENGYVESNSLRFVFKSGNFDFSHPRKVVFVCFTINRKIKKNNSDYSSVSVVSAL